MRTFAVIHADEAGFAGFEDVFRARSLQDVFQYISDAVRQFAEWRIAQPPHGDCWVNVPAEHMTGYRYAMMLRSVGPHVFADATDREPPGEDWARYLADITPQEIEKICDLSEAHDGFFQLSVAEVETTIDLRGP